MTPKEKAKYLLYKMYGVTDYQAKQCALIAVDELIKVTRAKFWYDVKHELLKIK
jgi:hypothetical protein